MRKGKLRGKAERVCEHVRNTVASSAIVIALCNYRSLDRRFANGAFGGADSGGGRAFVRRACLRARDGSAILRFFRWLGRFLLRGSLRSYGSLFLLSSLFGILGRLARGRFSVAESSFVLPVALLAASILLLHARMSLSHALEKSFLCNWFLFTVCRLPRDRLVFGAERGADRPWLTLVISLSVGALTSFVHPAYPLLAAALLLGLALISAVPELIFLAVVFLLPFLNWLPHPTLVFGGLVILGAFLWLCKALCGHRELPFGLLEFFMLLFGVLLFLGGVFGAGGMASFGRAAWMTALLFSCFPVTAILSQRLWRNRILLALCLSAAMVSLVGVGQYLFGVAELKWVDVSRFSDIGGRVTSFFSNPNVLAVYLLLTFPLMLGEGLKAEHAPKARILFLLTAAMEIACLVLTWSRGAWLGAIAALLLFFLLCSKRSMQALLWSVIPVIIWLPLLPHNIIHRFSSIGMLTESSIRYRLYTWRGALRMLWEHPFGIGVGEEAFFAVYQRFAVSGTETVTHTHNLFLQIAVELGLPGLFCFLTVLFFFLQTSLELMHLRKRSTASRGVLGGLCAMVGVLVMGFFDNVWYHYGLFWLFWFVLAATSGTARALKQDAEEWRDWYDEARLAGRA